MEFTKLSYNVTETNGQKKMEQTKQLGLVPQELAKGKCFEINFVIGNVVTVNAKIAPNQFKKVQNSQGQETKQIIGFASQIRTTDNKIDTSKFESRGEAAQGVLKKIWDCVLSVKKNCNIQESHKIMTRKEAWNLINESLIDQDEKFTREITALFKQQETIDLLQNAYDMSDDNAKLSLMDATEKQFLDKFAAKGGSGDEKEEKENDTEDGDNDDDFLADGADLDAEDDGSDNDSSDDSGSDNTFTPEETPSNDTTDDGVDANPFASFGDGGSTDTQENNEPVNPFESLRTFKPSKKNLNESQRPSRFIRRKK